MINSPLEEMHILDPNLPKLQGVSLKGYVIPQSASAFPFDPHANNNFPYEIPWSLRLSFLNLLILTVLEKRNEKSASSSPSD